MTVRNTPSLVRHHGFSRVGRVAVANMFQFTCFNVDDPDDNTVGLVNGELAIPGNLLRREVFDPVVDQVSPRPIIDPLFPR